MLHPIEINKRLAEAAIVDHPIINGLRGVPSTASNRSKGRDIGPAKTVSTEDTTGEAYWNTPSKKYLISEMDDLHIHNAIRYCLRNKPDSPIIKVLRAELYRRHGDDESDGKDG